MSLGRFLISKNFFRQLLIAIGIVVVLFISAWFGLASYTQHGKHFTLPDYTGLTLADIEQYRIAKGFEFIVLDSVYNDLLPGGSIVSQDPPPNSRVKKNRKIYLSTVAVLPEQVSMPDLVDLTFRQAMSTLETYGLKIGKFEYVHDIAKNAVLQQLHEGEVIEPGTFITKGSHINLTLGKGLGSERIAIPFLLGLTQEEAHRRIHEYYLKVGANIFETENEADTTTTRVYKQNPGWRENAFVRMGQQIDLWYRSELAFDFDSLLRIYQPDTIPYYIDRLLYIETYYDTIF